ncbi:MAG: hypothetical protein PHY93_05825 [Bacteriovorax sp.]|nr:hypothetical protein [Bacteriovorax sp.]
MKKMLIIFFFLPLIVNGEIYKKLVESPSVIYLEAPTKVVSIHCEHPKYVGKGNLIGNFIYVEFPNEIYEMIFRRGSTGKECQRRLNEIKKIIRQNKIVRVLGISPMVSEYGAERQVDDRGLLSPNLKGRKVISSFFERIDNNKDQCFEYFKGSCKKDIKEFL